MTRMKDSGNPWVREIPSNWFEKKLRYLVELRGEKSVTTDYKKYVGLENVMSQTGQYVQTGIEVDLTENLTFEVGDILFGKLRPYLRKYWRAEFSGTASSEFVIIKGSSLNLHFLFWAIQSDSFINDVDSSTYGSKMPRASWEYMKNIKLPFPESIEEQAKIADFLDKKVAQLDKVKSLLEEQIKTLEDYRQSLIYETVTKGLDKTVPLKDSGVDWIGQIPEGCGVSRLDMYVAIYGRIGFRGYTSSDIVEEGEGAISLSPSNIVEHKVVNYNNTYVSWDKYDESPEIQVQEGNILYVKTGSSYGKAGLVTSLSEKSTINPQLVIFKCRKYVEARYINYLLNCQLGKDQSELIVGGSTIPTISQEKLRKMQFPYISFDDQNQIANFLDKKTEQINQMIAIKKEQIENINKQRQTLIYDYVTGKRRV